VWWPRHRARAMRTPGGPIHACRRMLQISRVKTKIPHNFKFLSAPHCPCSVFHLAQFPHGGLQTSPRLMKQTGKGRGQTVIYLVLSRPAVQTSKGRGRHGTVKCIIVSFCFAPSSLFSHYPSACRIEVQSRCRSLFLHLVLTS
jgi:hypothetical protein